MDVRCGIDGLIDVDMLSDGDLTAYLGVSVEALQSWRFDASGIDPGKPFWDIHDDRHAVDFSSLTEAELAELANHADEIEKDLLDRPKPSGLLFFRSR